MKFNILQNSLIGNIWVVIIGTYTLFGAVGMKQGQSSQNYY